MNKQIKLPVSVTPPSLDRLCMAISNTINSNRTVSIITADDVHTMLTDTLAIPVSELNAADITHILQLIQATGIDAYLVLLDMNDKEAMPLTTAFGEYVDFGDVCRDRCGQQSQYGVGYLKDRLDRPSLGFDLRVRGASGRELDLTDYHNVEIHKDDVDTFVERVLTYRVAIGNIDIEQADTLRKEGMRDKKFVSLGVNDILTGTQTLDVVEGLLTAHECLSDPEGGAGLIRKLCQLRPGQMMKFMHSGTFVRLAD